VLTASLNHIRKSSERNLRTDRRRIGLLRTCLNPIGRRAAVNRNDDPRRSVVQTNTSSRMLAGIAEAQTRTMTMMAAGAER
jgi:hypothetical protein